MNDKTNITIINWRNDHIIYNNRIDYLQFTQEGCMNPIVQCKIVRFDFETMTFEVDVSDDDEDILKRNYVGGVLYK